MKSLKIALGRQLRNCINVITLGVRPSLNDYSPSELELIRKAEKIYFPTHYYADVFAAMGKETFPNTTTYRLTGDKIKQSLLFGLVGVPHPKTGIYVGKRQKAKIPQDFDFPMVAKRPLWGSGGTEVYLLNDKAGLETYCSTSRVAYIQEYLPIKKDLRVVLINHRVIHAYWRIAKKGEFRTNVKQGARICFGRIPEEALHLAVEVSRRCGFDHVGLDICISGGKLYVLEANMRYGTEGFRQANLDYRRLLKEMVETDQI